MSTFTSLLQAPRRLGRTEVRVSALGFGGAPLGGLYEPLEMDAAGRAVALALELGIHFFDTSPYYGDGLSETRLGELLAGRRPQVVLQTKCGRYGRDEFDFSAARLRASCELSLRRLRTDYVDVLLAHDIEFGRQEQILGETLPALIRLREEGKARAIGVSGYPLEVLSEVIESSEIDVVLSYCHFNLMISQLDAQLLPLARERQIGLLNASPLHMGVLTRLGPPVWHPAPPAVLAAGQRLLELAESRGFDLPMLALRHCLDHEGIASTLVGMTRPEQVAANVAAAGMAIPPEIRAEIDAIVDPVRNLTWEPEDQVARWRQV